MPKIWYALLIFSMLLAPWQSRAADATPFVVYDGTKYVNKPDLGVFGLKPISIVATSREAFVPTVNTDDWRWYVSHGVQGNTPVVFDVEVWFIRGIDQAQDQQVVDKYMEMMSIARQMAPGVSMGFYGMMPVPVNWQVVKDKPALLAQRDAADRTLLPLANAVDAIYISMYTFDPDPDHWEEGVKAAIQEARRYHKPVYGFIWPQYHNLNKQLGGQPIPPEFWARQLAVCRRYADGIVIWGGHKQNWDPDAPWWQETLKFMHQQVRH